jgi:hypothetical protein
MPTAKNAPSRKGRNDSTVAHYGTDRNNRRRTRQGAVAVSVPAASGRSADMTSLFGISLLLGLTLGLAGLLRLISP